VGSSGRWLVGIAGGSAALGAGIALGQSAIAACLFNPSACSRAFSAGADIAMGDALGGYGIAAGTAGAALTGEAVVSELARRNANAQVDDITRAARNTVDEVAGRADDVVNTGSTSGWTSISRDSRAVLRDIEAHSGVSVPQSQRELLANGLRQTDYTYAVSRADYQVLQREYAAQRNTLKRDWEKATGQTWPKTPAGIDYQAHHIIPHQYGGPNVWWNLHPVPGGAAHQGGVHGAGSPTTISFPQRPPRRP